MDWDKLRVFHSVADAGNFTLAGEALRLSQSAISRPVGAPETSLDTPFFHRHARGLLLTEQGELLYRTVHEVFTCWRWRILNFLNARNAPRDRFRLPHIKVAACCIAAVVCCRLIPPPPSGKGELLPQT